MRHVRSDWHHGGPSGARRISGEHISRGCTPSYRRRPLRGGVIFAAQTTGQSNNRSIQQPVNPTTGQSNNWPTSGLVNQSRLNIDRLFKQVVHLKCRLAFLR